MNGRVCKSQRADTGKLKEYRISYFCFSTLYLSNMANALTYRDHCYVTSARPPYWKGPDSTVDQFKSMDQKKLIIIKIFIVMCPDSTLKIFIFMSFLKTTYIYTY